MEDEKTWETRSYVGPGRARERARPLLPSSLSTLPIVVPKIHGASGHGLITRLGPPNGIPRDCRLSSGRARFNAALPVRFRSVRSPAGDDGRTRRGSAEDSLS